MKCKANVALKELKKQNGHTTQFLNDKLSTITGRNLDGTIADGRIGSELGGRPVGSKDKINRLRNELLDVLLELRNGRTNVSNAVRTCLASKPGDVLSLASRLIPRDIELSGDVGFAPVFVAVAGSVGVRSEGSSMAQDERSEGGAIDTTFVDGGDTDGNQGL